MFVPQLAIVCASDNDIPAFYGTYKCIRMLSEDVIM